MNNLKRTSLVFGSIGSLALLGIVFIIKLTCPSLLEIDGKWLIVAALPLIISLIVGEFIRFFKGFGFEIETYAHSTLASNTSIVEYIKAVSVATKQDVEFLYALTPAQKKETNTLRLTYNLQGYYTTDALRQYLNAFPNLTFLEAVNPAGQFLFLVDLGQQEPSLNFLSDLISLIEGRPGSLNRLHNFEIVRMKLTPSSTLVEALQALREQRNKTLPVINNDGILIGCISRERITDALATEVLRSLNQKRN